MSTPLAVVQAIDAAIDPPEDDEPDQLALFGEPLTAAGLAKLPIKARGPGRPPGARNRRTERNVAYLLSRHRDPVEVLLEIAEANPHDLAGLIGCTPHEALQEKRLAALAAAPYVKAKITPDVVDNRQVINLTIGTGMGAGDGGFVGQVVQVLEAGEAEVVSAADDDGSRG